jgi:SSS family solute:Na+ symporter
VITALIVLVYGVLGGLRAAYWTDLVQGIFIILLSVLLIPVGLNALLDKARENPASAETFLAQRAFEEPQWAAQTYEDVRRALAEENHPDDDGQFIADRLLAAERAEDTLSDPDVSEAERREAATSFGTAIAALEARFGDLDALNMLDGFALMHKEVPDEYFEIVESPIGGDFPLHYIIAISLLNLVGIVVQPHFIATGGGSAKTETSARVGLVAGNFMKRFCTIGWALTALLVLALMADNLELAEDPDRVWGVAARELLGPLQLGLVGLMLACLMAALMSSASCYMLVVSALIVRNGYAAFISSKASEATYVLLGRIIGALVIVGGTLISLYYLDVFEQLKITWELPILFAAPFWIGMFWRKATSWAAWLTILFSLAAFFAVPAWLPVAMPDLATNQQFTETNDIVSTVITRPVAPSDVARREAAIGLWNRQVKAWVAEEGPQSEEAIVEKFGPAPEPLQLGEDIQDKYVTGGKPIYWKEKVEPIDEQGNVLLFNEEGKVTGVAKETAEGRMVEKIEDDRAWYVLEEVERTETEDTLIVRRRFKDDVTLRGRGSFNLDFLLYEQAMGLDLTKMDDPTLETLRLPTRLVLPFVVMILLSLITPANTKEALDRFYVKMKTPVDPDPAADQFEMETSYQNPSRFDDRRLLKFFGLEFQKPSLLDVAGFVISFAICFLIIWFTVWVANIGR